MAKKPHQSSDSFNPADNPFALSEIKTDGAGVEPVALDKSLSEIAKDEAFLNEVVVIRVHESNVDGDLEVINPIVNGVSQPIVRGVATPVKRKYVEALAHSHETKYRQVTPNPNQPDDIRMVPKTVLSYPFEVINDPNPAGRPWLEFVLSQAA